MHTPTCMHARIHCYVLVSECLLYFFLPLDFNEGCRCSWAWRARTSGMFHSAALRAIPSTFTAVCVCVLHPDSVYFFCLSTLLIKHHCLHSTARFALCCKYTVTHRGVRRPVEEVFTGGPGCPPAGVQGADPPAGWRGSAPLEFLKFWLKMTPPRDRRMTAEIELSTELRLLFTYSTCHMAIENTWQKLASIVVKSSKKNQRPKRPKPATWENLAHDCN